MNEMFLWVKEILVIIISLTFFQILIPDSTMSRYLQFIFSLIILAVILDPVVHLLGGEYF